MPVTARGTQRVACLLTLIVNALLLSGCTAVTSGEGKDGDSSLAFVFEKGASVIARTEEQILRAIQGAPLPLFFCLVDGEVIRADTLRPSWRCFVIEPRGGTTDSGFVIRRFNGDVMLDDPNPPRNEFDRNAARYLAGLRQAYQSIIRGTELGRDP